MTIDRTLKPHGGLVGTRSVLSRSERIAKLLEEGKFNPETNSPLGLPKVRVRHSKAGTKTKKVAEEAAPAATEGAAVATTEAAPAKGAAGKPTAAKPTAAAAAKPVAAKPAKGGDKKK